MASKKQKAQTSVEYIIILAVIMVIALVAIGLSIFFGQISGDSVQTEINTYWSTQARPLRIVEMQGYYYGGAYNGEIAIMLENVDSKPINVTNFVLDGITTFSVFDAHSTNGANAGSSMGTAGVGQQLTTIVRLAPSEKKGYYLRVTPDCTTNSKQRFSRNLTIYYNTPYFQNVSFKGIKQISQRCNGGS